jgi:hypothetical protein
MACLGGGCFSELLASILCTFCLGVAGPYYYSLWAQLTKMFMNGDFFFL